MSSTSSLDAEELEHVPLVRMADIQPDRSSEKVLIIYERDDSDSQSGQDEPIETFVVDGSELPCAVEGDEDSNIGSIVSVQSEDMLGEEETELIVPEVLESVEVPIDYESPSPPPIFTKISPIIDLIKPTPPESWPTLEILPGGVINLADKTDSRTDSLLVEKDQSDVGDMIYACAKCSQSFQYLFCLVKHVRWHEEENQKKKLPNKESKSPVDKKTADPVKNKTVKGIQIKEEPKEKIVKNPVKEKYICLHSGKRKIIPKPKVRRAPKNTKFC